MSNKTSEGYVGVCDGCWSILSPDAEQSLEEKTFVHRTCAGCGYVTAPGQSIFLAPSSLVSKIVEGLQKASTIISTAELLRETHKTVVATRNTIVEQRGIEGLAPEVHIKLLDSEVKTNSQLIHLAEVIADCDVLGE